MKIKTEHFNHMREAILPLRPDVPLMRAQIEQEGKAKDPDKRLRWDLSYAAGLTGYICNVIYPYADDSHIDTALKKIMAEMN